MRRSYHKNNALSKHFRGGRKRISSNGRWLSKVGIDSFRSSRIFKKYKSKYKR